MKYKTLIAALVCLLIAAVPAFAADYSDIADDPALDEAVSILSRLDIISGGDDGLYRPGDNLTRAEFSKIATYLSGAEENAVSTGVPFVDVPTGHWATAYIGYVSNTGIISGYPDGTFAPEEKISWAQALTVTVRVLGYSGEDVAYRWPDGYIEKAQAIGLLDGLTVTDYNAPITRGEAALLFQNALFTDMKNGGELISMRKVTRAEDVAVIADSLVDVTLASDMIKTSAGSFKVPEDPEQTPQVGDYGDLYYDTDSRIVTFVPEAETVRTLTVTSTFMNAETNKVEINYTENGAAGTESFELNRPLYNEGSALTIGNGYQLMGEGSQLKLYYDSEGGFRRAMLSTVTLAGPKVVESESFSPVREFNIADTSTLRVIRKGLTAKLSDIERFDVLYYAENTNTLYAYADSVTGIYEKAHPIKANVTSITLSGTEYELATQDAINKLNESPGAFAINDRITLLKGRNGEIVGVADTDSADLLGYGVIQNAYTVISQDEDNLGREEYWVTVFTADGASSDYRCDADYTDYIGEFRRLVFTDGALSLEKVKYNVFTGVLDASVPSLAGHWFANDFGIIELVSLPDNGPATLRTVSLDELNRKSLTISDIIHIQTVGEMDDISILYLGSVTKEQYSYGVIKEKEESSEVISTETKVDQTGQPVVDYHFYKYSYTVLLGNQEVVLNNNYLFDTGEAIGYGTDEDGETNFISLAKIGEGKTVTAVTSNRIKVDDTIYTMSGSAVAYGGDYPKNYRALSLDELTDIENVKSVTLYSDRSISSGGSVRVIILNIKED